VEDPDDINAAGNRVKMFSMSARFYPVNKDKFALYTGMNFGYTLLSITRTYTFGSSTTIHDYKWDSSHLEFDLGFNWYFARQFGINFNLGYTAHNFDLEEYSIDNIPQDPGDWSHKFITKGIHVAIGAAYHFFGE
jgi:hypothetical protein